jgi:phosphoribosylformimino-5-aminoimidazole carboxamide ribotide isomerase
MSAATVFNEDPAAQAKSFADAGCRWLHLVDLDGAFAGKPMNAASVEAIIKAVQVPVQLGGGIRDLATIEGWLGKGIARVILGTAALTNPDLVKEACRKFPGKVVVGIDARGGKVAVEGWAKTSEMMALDLARRVEDAGAAAIIFTDIDRDGALAGVNVAATAALARALQTPVIASGGVASIDDIAALKARESDGIAGAILGRSLYDGRVDLKAALAMVG